ARAVPVLHPRGWGVEAVHRRPAVPRGAGLRRPHPPARRSLANPRNSVRPFAVRHGLTFERPCHKLIQLLAVPMEFRCRLASPNGEIVEGVYVADSESRLRHELEEKGLYVLSLQPKNAIAGISLRLPQRKGIATREFLVFNQELATLLKAGMPLVQSLDLLKRRVESPVFRSVLDDVHEKVRSGTALSDAFGMHGELFPSVYTASILAGERSGNLDAVLRRYVEYTKIIQTVKSETVSALVYPAILITLAIGLVTIIVLKVVPAFSDFYATFGADLPLITRIIVRISDVLRSQFLLIIGIVVVAVAVIVSWVKQPGQKARFDHLLLGLPVLGQIARKFSTSQM